MNLPSVKQLHCFQHLASVLIEKAVRNVDAIIRIDADDVSIKGGVMNPGKRQSVRQIGLFIGP